MRAWSVLGNPLEFMKFCRLLQALGMIKLDLKISPTETHPNELNELIEAFLIFLLRLIWRAVPTLSNGILITMGILGFSI